MLGYREAMVSWLLLWSASPHPTLLAPNWSTHSKYMTTGQSGQQRLMEAVLVYYLLLPSSSWQVPRGCPQAAQRNTRHHPDQQWLTSYTEGGPCSTQREDHILHRWRTATEKRILLKLCCFLTLWMQCAGLGHINASMYGGVCSLLPLRIPGTKFRL